MKGQLLIIGGPTGTGKTALSVQVAKTIGGEIVSCDSMQIYRGLDVGTAKVTEAETQGIPHHMIDVVAPTEQYSVAEYQRDASAVIEDIHARGKVPILVGGTGLYINAVLFPMQFKQYDPAVRRRIEALYATHGNEYMYALLVTRAPEMAAKLSPNDVKRVTRALELTEEGERHNTDDLSKTALYDYRMYVLTGDRQDMYDRINARVERMLMDGLLDEVKRLLADGVPHNAQCFQAIAYKEIAAYLRGEYDFERAVELIKQRSRNYAKRQLTWFKQYKNATWLLYNDAGNAARVIRDYEEWND